MGVVQARLILLAFLDQYIVVSIFDKSKGIGIAIDYHALVDWVKAKSAYSIQ